MKRIEPNLERHIVPDCGHQKRPAEVNRLQLDWLKRRFPV